MMDMRTLDLEVTVSAREIIKRCDNNRDMPAIIREHDVSKEIIDCMGRILKKEKVMRTQ